MTLSTATRTITLALLLAACGEEGATTTTAGEEGAGLTARGTLPEHRASIELFVMSKCPYGVQVETTMAEVKKSLGGAFDLAVHYIGDGDATALTSMHGPTEVAGDIAQVCANKQKPEKTLDFITCQNKDVKGIDSNWKSCGEENGLDGAALASCVEGDEGKQLLAASFAIAKERGARSSPTIYLDGEKYAGGRKPTDFIRALCATYGEDAPVACANIPVPPAVDAIFLSDERCEKCDLHPLEGKLKGELGGLKVKYVDYATDEGRALYADLQKADASFKFLPAVLLSKSAEEDKDGYAAISKFARPLGDYIELKVGGKFDPTAEICDNNADDDGDGKVDCTDDGCTASLTCREAIPGKLDLFVMSRCPYGAKAMVAANELLPSFGKDIDLEVHFIGNDNNGELSSMHGPAEVDDDVREVCAQAKYPDTFLKFLGCHSENYKSDDWQSCATKSGMDPKVIQTCFDGEGKDLLRKSFASTAALGIGSSPTFLVNNKRTFNAVTAPDLQRQICTDNPSFKGCANMVQASAATTAPVPQGECN